MTGLRRTVDRITSVIVLLMVAYQLLFVMWHMHNPDLHLELHLLFALAVVYLSLAKNTQKSWLYALYLLAAAAGIGICSYLYIYYEELVFHQLFNEPHELVLGGALIFLCMFAVWRSWGPLIPVVVIIITVYPIFGRYLPEPFYASCYPLDQFLGYLSVTANSGLHSRALYVSASFLFLFIVFGSILDELGATKFFIELGRWAATKVRGGPAMMSVISSAGIGSINGSAIANINITGAFTIPLMKSAGYKPEQAAGIEVASSSGGQILPPIMGVVAFFMAGLTGIPYAQICAMAVIPALLYFFNVGCYAYLNAGKREIDKAKDVTIDRKELLWSLPLVAVPFVIIIGLLVSGHSVLYVSFWAIISTVIVTAIRKKTRPSFNAYINAFVNGGKRGAQLAVMMAIVGLMMTSATMSGLPIKLGAGIQYWSGGNVVLTLLIVWAVSIIMGLIGVELIGYIILSMFVITGLEASGVPFATAHFFIIFSVAFGIITPPIALAAMVASNLAQSNYLRTAIEGVKAGGLGLLLPFMFVSSPVLLAQPRGVAEGITTMVASVTMILSAQIAFTGYYMGAISNNLIRFFFILTGVALLASIFVTNYLLFGLGMAGFFILSVYLWQAKSKQNKVERDSFAAT